MTDGNIHLTTISSDVLAALFNSLHETKHREGAVGPLTAAEEALYVAVVAELTARAGDVARKERMEGNRWIILLNSGDDMVGNPPLIVEGTLAEARKVGNDAALHCQARSYEVVPFVVSAEGKR